MNAPQEPAARPAPTRRLARRVAATAIMSGLIFLLLWLVAFSAFTSLLIASGCCVVVVAASATFDPVLTVLDAIATVLFEVLGAIADFFAGLFN
jgi:hypothetical protein